MLCKTGYIIEWLGLGKGYISFISYRYKILEHLIQGLFHLGEERKSFPKTLGLGNT